LTEEQEIEVELRENREKKESGKNPLLKLTSELQTKAGTVRTGQRFN
jgi:hypothetical protein